MRIRSKCSYSDTHDSGPSYDPIPGIPNCPPNFKKGLRRLSECEKYETDRRKSKLNQKRIRRIFGIGGHQLAKPNPHV